MLLWNVIDLARWGRRRHQALPNKDDGPPLKAILAHDSLVHPDHPLRNGDPRGIELYMGTPSTSQSHSRLIALALQARSKTTKLGCFSRPNKWNILGNGSMQLGWRNLWFRSHTLTVCWQNLIWGISRQFISPTAVIFAIPLRFAHRTCLITRFYPQFTTENWEE